MNYLFLIFLQVKINWFVNQFSIIQLNFYVNSCKNILLYPLQSYFYTEAGETALVFFRLVNLSNQNYSIVTTYTIFPQIAGVYINKLQCFCFEMIHVKPREQLDLPVVFFVSHSLKTDFPLLKKIILYYDVHKFI
uniref:Cytochrome c oxidase subunit 11 n=1 Tax=Pharyngomonas kirbyi TaxID=63601 RepID=A0A1W6R270_9EUKA|nr:cytochrome c oxidase subunit 11 [Pharyngomonas kirbyi]ARO47991.1 cytochrome c oxidase subunit 11 [Pharyngomonas kirbyi]